MSNNAAFHYDNSIRFVYALAMAVERYAGHSHDTDLFLHRIIRALGLHGNIHATPNSMIIGLWQDDETHQNVFTVPTRGTQYDMTRLSEIMDLVVELENGRISPDEGLVRLRRIESAPGLYASRYIALTFLGSGMAFGVILGLSWMEVFLGGVLSLMSYRFERLAHRIPGAGTILEFLVSVASAFLAGVTAMMLPGTHSTALTLCAVIIYVPGFGLTIAPREIILGDTLSGLIYFTNALFISVKILFGALVGLGIADYLFTLPVAETVAGVPHLLTWVFAPILPLCIAVQFDVSPRRLWLVVTGALLVWSGIEFGGMAGPWQGSLLGAFILAVYSRLTALRFNFPVSTVLLPVVMILVPGLGFIKFLYALRAQGIVAGAEIGLQLFVIIAAIMGGVFLGNFAASAATNKKTG